MTFNPPEIIGPFWGLSELFVSLVKRSKSDATSKDRHSFRLIWLVYLAASALGIVAAYQLPSCRLPWPKLAVGAGICLFLMGSALRWYSIFHLGRFFTVNVAIARDHRVVHSGPYHYVRHPSYTGGLLAVLGFALTFSNWASVLLVVMPCFAVQMWRIQIEELALVEALGDPYRAYMLRTKRLIPFIY